MVGKETARMKLQLHEIEKDAKYMVSANRLSGSAFAFFQSFETIRDEFKKDMKDVGAEEEKKE